MNTMLVNSDELRESLARNVRRIRRERGISQQTLADRADICRATINRIENQRHIPEADVLYSIADALGVSSDDLRKSEKIHIKTA